jgi:hypothetical protein
MADDDFDVDAWMERNGDRQVTFRNLRQVIDGAAEDVATITARLFARIRELELRLEKVDGIQMPPKLFRGDGTSGPAERSLPTMPVVGARVVEPDRARPRVRYRGHWDAEALYHGSDGVLHAGKTWRSTLVQSGCEPGSHPAWERL